MAFSTLKEVYGVLFSPEFVDFYDQRRHIWLERMDLEWNLKAIHAWIHEKEDESERRKNFCLHHIQATTGVFDWNLKESEISHKD